MFMIVTGSMDILQLIWVNPEDLLKIKNGPPSIYAKENLLSLTETFKEHFVRIYNSI